MSNRVVNYAKIFSLLLMAILFMLMEEFYYYVIVFWLLATIINEIILATEINFNKRVYRTCVIIIGIVFSIIVLVIDFNFLVLICGLVLPVSFHIESA